MLEILKEVENNLEELLLSNNLHSMCIDYHKPFVKRIWFQYGKYRVYLHKIEYSSDLSEDMLFHPHPWKSAMKILKGSYEMGIGHSETMKIPEVDCKLILCEGNYYEMTNTHGWHYVKPLNKDVITLMVTGDKLNRKMPLEVTNDFRKLNQEETSSIIYDIINALNKTIMYKNTENIIDKIDK